MEETMANAKAIFVDGASLWNMMRILDVGQVKNDELYGILVRELAESVVCFGKPFYTTTVAMKKRLDVAGYEAVVADSKTAEDDRMINDRILSLQPQQVSEVILVSADILDYANCLRAKKTEGMKITLVATRESEPAERGSRPVLSSGAQNLIDELGITFVELRDYADRLREKPFVDKRQQKSIQAGAAGVRLMLLVPDGSNALPTVFDIIGQIRANHPEVFFTLTNFPDDKNI